MGSDRLFSYWSGPISWMERLSVASAQTLGYDVTVFSFEPTALESAGLGCTIADARSVMGPDVMARYRLIGYPQMTDHFRIEGIGQGHGTWFDLDVVFVKRLPSEPYLFGRHTETAINNAIIRFPPDSDILSEYLTMYRQRRSAHQLPPWYPWPNRVARRLRSVGCYLIGQHQPSSLYGPRTLTHLVYKHGLTHLAKAPDVFYPVPSNKDGVAAVAKRGLRQFISPQTVCIHLWRSFWTPAQLSHAAWAQEALHSVP